MGFIKQGRDVAKQEQKENQARIDSMKVKQLLLKEDEETKIVFLTEEPVSVYVHKVRMKSKNGKVYWAWVICTIDKDDPKSRCTFCEAGHKPTYQNAYPVIDRRNFNIVKDRQGKFKEVKITMTKRGGTLFVLMIGQKSIPLIEKKYEKYKKDFLHLTFDFYRTGSGTDTAYHIEKADGPKIKKIGESKEEKAVLKSYKDFTWETFFTPPSPSVLRGILRINGLIEEKASEDQVDDSDEEGDDVDYE